MESTVKSQFALLGPLLYRRVAHARNAKKRLKTTVKSTHLNVYFKMGLPYTQATNGWPHKMRGRFIAGTADIFEAWLQIQC